MFTQSEHFPPYLQIFWSGFDFYHSVIFSDSPQPLITFVDLEPSLFTSLPWVSSYKKELLNY